MNKRNNLSYFEDIIGCLLVIILICINYSTLLSDGGGPRGESLINIFIILNYYLGKIGVYALLVLLFLWFLISAIRKILKK